MLDDRRWLHIKTAAEDDPGILMAEVVLNSRHDLVEELSKIATYQASLDEVRAAVRLLTGSKWELDRYRPDRLRQVAVFLPSNNILYSYVLFGVMSAMYADGVVMRPAAAAHATAARVHEILGDTVRAVTGSAVELTSESQRSFRERCADAQAVVFNGQYTNGFEIARRLPRTVVVLGFCAGPNPMVVGPEADVVAACDRLLAQRLFNSGQDCLCTDLVFVHSSLAEEFSDILTRHLAGLSFGERADPATVISPLYYINAVTAAADFLHQHRDWVSYGGEVDVESRRVAPTIVRFPSEVEFHPPEFFAPIFALQSYDDALSVHNWLNSPQELRRGMYVSIFGEPAFVESVIGTSVVCAEATTFDVEDGNAPFGGYGEQANFVWQDGRPCGRPLLLSSEVARRGGQFW